MIILYLIIAFGFGIGLGYRMCRHNLWCIAKDQLTALEHANLFGYPYKKPTIEELQKILDKE